MVLTPASRTEEFLEAAISEQRPQLFCLTAVSSQYPAMREAAAAIKRIDPSIFTVLGGVHASLNPEEVISNHAIDALCIGEGDHAVKELARQLAAGRRPSGINNLWLKDGDGSEIERNEPAPFIKDLDSLPTIERRIWRRWIADCDGPQYVVVGRGCPNNCTYCTNHALRRMAPGRYIRFRSPGRIIDEIEEIVSEFGGVKEIYLEADTLAIDMDYTFDLLSSLAEFNDSLAEPIEFGTNLAPMKNVVTNKELLDTLQRANFRYINIGLESGSERLRRDVLKRPHYSNEAIIEFCREVRERSIDVHLYMMIGLPTETPGEWRKTIEVARCCRPTDARLSIFYPYPGTELHRTCEEKGLMKRKAIRPDRERKRPALALKEFPPRKVQREFVLFFYNFYRGEMSWFARVRRSLRAAISSRPALDKLYKGFVPKLKSLLKRGKR